jgi:hypothetical protein
MVRVFCCVISFSAEPVVFPAACLIDAAGEPIKHFSWR